jgi:hypothetical protein
MNKWLRRALVAAAIIVSLFLAILLLPTGELQGRAAELLGQTIGYLLLAAALFSLIKWLFSAVKRLFIKVKH